MSSHLSRRAFLALSTGTAATILAACAPTPTPKPAPTDKPQPTQVQQQATATTQPTAAPTVPPTTAPKVKLQFMWWPVGGERGLKAMDAALKPFEDANPNITIERIPVTTIYIEKVLTVFAGGTPPDNLAINSFDLAGLAERNVLVNLGELITGDKSFSLDVFFDAAQKQGVWKGKRWALPYIGSPRILFYNADLIQKKGLETPDKLWEAGKWTWDKLLEYATALTDRSGGPANTVYGFNDDRGLAMGGIWPWVWGAKGDVINADYTKCLLNTAESVAGLKYVQDLIFKHQVMPKADAMKDVDLLSTGRVAIWPSWRGLTMAYRALPFKWDVVPFPVGPAGKLTLYWANHQSIAKATKYLPEAWMLCKHVTGKVADAAYVLNGGATPRKDNLDVLMSSTPPQNNQYFYVPLNEGWARQPIFDPKWMEWSVASNTFMARIYNDNEDVKKVADEMAAAIDKILAAS